jgi:hypothetical protein
MSRIWSSQLSPVLVSPDCFSSGSNPSEIGLFLWVFNIYMEQKSLMVGVIRLLVLAVRLLGESVFSLLV